MFGPRGTGKSTWLRETYPDALLIDLLREDVKIRLEANPERVAELVDGNPNAHTVIIDEVRRVGAIEVKNAARLSPSDFSGLKAFASDYPEARRILLYRGSERLLKDGVECIPAGEFLKGLVPGVAGWAGGGGQLPTHHPFDKSLKNRYTMSIPFGGIAMSYASVFINGGSQAVRIPAAYRFDTDCVSVEAVDGGILLRPVCRRASWKRFFEVCDAHKDELKDFELERPANVSPSPKEFF